MRFPIEAVRSRDISENVAAHIIDDHLIQVHPTSRREPVESEDLIPVLVVSQGQSSRVRSGLLYFGGYGLVILDRRYPTDTLFIPE